VKAGKNFELGDSSIKWKRLQGREIEDLIQNTPQTPLKNHGKGNANYITNNTLF